VVAVDKLGHRAEASRTYTVVAAPTGGSPPAGDAPVVPKAPGGPKPTPGRTFRARPVVVSLQRMTSSSSLSLRLRNSEAFAITGQAVLRGAGKTGKPKAAKVVALSAAKAFALKPGGQATVVLKLNRAARRALRGGRTVAATLTLTLRSGTATKTMTQAVRLKVRRR
jgi:hypothetical protein